MNIAPLPGPRAFGAVVTGVRVAHLTDAEFAEILAAFHEHGLLVFPGQHLTEPEQASFGARFGELEFADATLGNLFGKRILPPEHSVMKIMAGNEAWHTDSTYMPVSAKAGLLTARTLPPSGGGGTAFADGRSAYDTLPDAMKTRIANLSAYHSTVFSQARDLGDYRTGGPRGIYHDDAYLRPLVKVHPVTGRKILFVGRHAFGIPGLTRDDSRALLSGLLRHATSSDAARVYTHDWRVGDLCVWDNRCILHRAMPYNPAEPRSLLGTRVIGDVASEAALNLEDADGATDTGDCTSLSGRSAAMAGRAALRAELAVLRQEQTRKREARGGRGRGRGVASSAATARSRL